MLNFTIAPFRYRMEPVSQITSGHGAPFSNLRAQTISIGPRRPPHTAGVRMIFFVVSSVSSFSTPTAVPNIPYPSSFGFPMVPVFHCPAPATSLFNFFFLSWKEKRCFSHHLPRFPHFFSFRLWKMGKTIFSFAEICGNPRKRIKSSIRFRNSLHPHLMIPMRVFSDKNAL